ncbi:ScbA/BarX family gamma-butyrolactone biosynthesis protein [Streptomyces pini]|uniref:A-factor biosynthesis hotdog domain-containing protein n=1 Tax=Streptomyces pini TaxID=1520580 RepID=A0A1I4LZE6_9ACTN|nr:ScbA/BarX family gamma-butyrolactone biosynthesis protein [Streptomyces pini]SFL96136.1 A-factor biosynthesis hotdog domain-containing protein [Streptomyces pini]
MSATFADRPGTAVPQHMVHKHTHTEVLLTGWSAHADDAFTVTARWPRAHSFYRPRGHYESLLFAETVRQTLPLLSHEAFGVPFGHQFVWSDLSFGVAYDALWASDRTMDLTLTVECSEVTRRRAGFSSARVSVCASTNTTTVGHARTRFSVHSPDVYRRLRAGRHDTAAARASALRPTPGVLPASVGRHLPQDVVLAPTVHSDVWRLRVDLSHPILFDHPVDHAPGMLLLEATRQAVLSVHPTGDAVVTSMAARFHRYVELDRPAWVRLASGTHGSFSVSIDQDEQTCFEAEATTKTVSHGSVKRSV